MSTIDRIEAAAKEATEGPWVTLHNNGEVAGVTLLTHPDTQHDICHCETPGRQDAGKNATHIANMDPIMTLKFVELYRAAEAFRLACHDDPPLGLVRYRDGLFDALAVLHREAKHGGVQGGDPGGRGVTWVKWRNRDDSERCQRCPRRVLFFGWESSSEFVQYRLCWRHAPVEARWKSLALNLSERAKQILKAVRGVAE